MYTIFGFSMPEFEWCVSDRNDSKIKYVWNEEQFEEIFSNWTNGMSAFLRFTTVQLSNAYVWVIISKWHQTLIAFWLLKIEDLCVNDIFFSVQTVSQMILQVVYGLWSLEGYCDRTDFFFYLHLLTYWTHNGQQVAASTATYMVSVDHFTMHYATH